MFHLRTAQMHLNAAVSDRMFNDRRRPKIVKALACLREAYNKVEEARELFAEAEAEKGERYRSVPPGSKDMDTEYFLKAGSRRWLVTTVEISAPKV
jgi:hypothetical protein